MRAYAERQGRQIYESCRSEGGTPDILGGVQLRFLRQVADRDALAHDHFPVELLVDATCIIAQSALPHVLPLRKHTIPLGAWCALPALAARCRTFRCAAAVPHRPAMPRHISLTYVCVRVRLCIVHPCEYVYLAGACMMS